MKSIADFKRAATIGTVLNVVNHVYPDLSGERTVLRISGGRWELSYPEGHAKFGPGRGSWLELPKAKLARFENGAFTILRDSEWGDSGPFCTITVKEG